MTGRQTIAVLIALVALTVTIDAQAKRPEVLLQEALNKEKIAGDIDGAIRLLTPLAEHERPAIAARALASLGRLYDRLGQAQARSAYERVMRQYPNQAEAAKEASAWLAMHAAEADVLSHGPLHETLWSEARIEWPTPFPDGRSVIYIDWSLGSGNLAIRDLRTRRNRLLTTDAGYDFYENPVPSRDGKRIAYRYGERESVIRVASSDGTGARVVLRDNHAHWIADWSPDGKQLAAVRDNPDGTKSVVLIDVADGKTTQLLTVRAYPQVGGFSPDGRHLVYAVDAIRSSNDQDARPSENGGVFLLPIEGRRPIPLVEGPAVFSSAAWAPDGRHVVFASDRSQDSALWSVRVAAGKAEAEPVAVEHNFAGVFLRFTADGRLFYEHRETQTEAYIADFDSQTLTLSKPSPLSERAIGKNREPQISPDGRQVAFVRNTQPLATLVIRALETGEERNVTQFQTVYGAHAVQWFPDGRSLLIVHRAGMRKLFQKVDVLSGQTRTLFDAAWSVWTGVLSADGSALYYSWKDEERRLHLIRRQLDNGDETLLYRSEASPGIGLFGLSLSPDGSQLAFARNTEGDGRILMMMPSSGGTPREVLKSDQIYAQGSFGWTPDGKYLVSSVQPPHGNQQLTAISTATGEFKPLGVTMQGITSRMVSADGRRVVFTEVRNQIELRTLRNFLPASASGR